MNAELARADSGLVAASKDQWIEAIVRLAGDPALRRGLGAAGRARVERELNLEKAADAWAEVLA